MGRVNPLPPSAQGKTNMESKIQEIYDRLSTDQAFAEELKKFLKNKKIESAEDGMTAFVEFAKLHGYDITPDDMQAFIESQCKALTEEELEKINAAGAGGFCIIIGWGWNEAYGIGWTKCSIIGAGLGPTWKDSNDPANKEDSALAKKIVEKIANSGPGSPKNSF